MEDKDFIPTAENLIYAAKESVVLRRIHVICLKMKIYLQRFKAMNSINFLKKIKKLDYIDYMDKEDFVRWIVYNKSIKREIQEYSDQINQYHIKAGTQNSFVLSYITSVMYYNADLWETINVLTMSNYLLSKKMSDNENIMKTISNLYELFKDLQKTDYDVIYTKHAIKLKNLNSKEKFDYLELH